VNYLKTSIGVFLILAASRFIPHPPNFTALIALGFYIPVFFGLRFVPIVAICFAVTDIFIGFHSTTLFTWGSVLFIGYISKYFTKSISFRIIGALSGAFAFFVITNFGVWIVGGYEKSIYGLIICYIAAIPFFTYTLLSTLLYSFLIELINSMYSLNKLKN
tara:strand:- start:72 stop:554 length:483 start_codon:yes stop_codon:yes gene_type:complete